MAHEHKQFVEAMAAKAGEGDDPAPLTWTSFRQLASAVVTEHMPDLREKVRQQGQSWEAYLSQVWKTTMEELHGPGWRAKAKVPAPAVADAARAERPGEDADPAAAEERARRLEREVRVVDEEETGAGGGAPALSHSCI